MKGKTNDRIVTVAGMSRGGTNLLWNVLQSHPSLIDSYYELNEIFGRKTGVSLLGKLGIELEALSHISLPGMSRYVRRRLQRFARFSFENDPYNRWKTPEECYNAPEFATLTICTKLVSAWEVDLGRQLLRRNDALKYLPILERAYNDQYVIFLARDGLAMLEGWTRRGAPVGVAARWYQRYASFYVSYVRRHRKAMLVRFEDLLQTPFQTSEKIYTHLGLRPTKLTSLRIALKPTVRSQRGVSDQTCKPKRWITSHNVDDYIDKRINEAQIARLSAQQQAGFLAIAASAMEELGYDSSIRR